jgi:hypothetical protein
MVKKRNFPAIFPGRVANFFFLCYITTPVAKKIFSQQIKTIYHSIGDISADERENI